MNAQLKPKEFVYRPYQFDMIDQARAALASLPKNERRIIIQAPTGSGKTAVAAKIGQAVVEKNKRVMFLCDTLELVEQALTTFDRVGLPVGVMQAQHERTDPARLMQVCSQATVGSWLKNDKLNRYDVGLIIVDEAHVQYAVRDRLAERYPEIPVIGLTATPFSRGLGLFYKGVVSAISIQDLISQEYLCGFQAYGPESPDFTGVKTSGGDWDMSDAADRYEPQIVANIVDTWCEQGIGRKTLLFACNVTHSKHLANEFQRAGVNAVHVDGYPTGRDEQHDRHQKIQMYHDGEIEILCSVGICTKGFDAPGTSCLIFARPTQSLALHWQMFGRGLRIAEGKDDCLVLDHAGNTLRHGYPTDVFDFELDTKESGKSKVDKREKKAKLPTPCPSCNFLKPAGVHRCPACQFAPEKQNEIVNIEGKLVKLKDVKGKEGSKKVWSKEEKQDFYSSLITIAKRRGYSSGWIAHTYKSFYKVWPKGLENIGKEPSLLAEKYVQHKLIAYAKAHPKNKRYA